MNAKWLAVSIALATVLSGLALLIGVPNAYTSVATPRSTAPLHMLAGPTPAAAPADLGWQPPVALESQTTANANLAGVALSSDGTGMIVWERGGARSVLMATHFIPKGGGDGGTNWQVPEQVSNSLNGIGFSYSGAVAMDSAGDAMAVYYSWGDLHGYTIYAALYKAGVGWQPPTVIDQPYDYSYNPVVAMNSVGDAFVVWEVWTGSYTATFANRYVPSTGWGTAQSLEPSTNNTYGQTIAVDAAGNALATWYGYAGGLPHVYAARYAISSGWLAPLLLATSANESYDSSVAMDAQGNGVVAWIERDTQWDIWAARYDHATGWATATKIEATTYYAGYYPGPDVAASNGNASVVWTMSGVTGAANIWVNRYVAGTGWVGEADLTGTSVPTVDGRVAVDPTGNVTITYQQQPAGSTPGGLNYNIALRYNHLTSSWGYAQLDYARAGSGAPLVAIDGSGNALAVWNYNDNPDATTAARNGLLTNVYTAPAGWQGYWTDQPAEWDEAIAPNWLQLETNTRGDAIFSFTQDDGPIWDGYAALYSPGTGWGTVTRLENMNSSGVTEEWSAIDGAGNALVLFRASDGTQFNVYATYYRVGTGWSAPHRLDATAGSNKFWLRVAMNDRGDGVAAWQAYNGTNWNAYAAFFTGASQSWSASVAVQTMFTYVGSSVVGIDGQGNVMVVYNAWNGTGYNDYASYAASGATFQAPVQIAHTSLTVGTPYTESANGGGQFAVSWSDWDGSRYVASANVFSPTAGWGTDPLFISGPGDEATAAPSLDGAGNAVLGYSVWDGSQFDVYSVSKPAAGAWGLPVRLSSGAGDASSVVTSFDYRGDGFAVWNEYNGYGYDTLARRYVSGVGWLPEIVVNRPNPATPTTDTGSPNLGIDGQGNAVLGWNEWENGALLPFASTYVVGNGLPALTLTSPGNDTFTKNPSVTVSGFTSPGVSISIDGSAVAVAAGGSFSQAYSLADGSHTFAVVATDAAGLSTSLSSTVTVDTQPPSLMVTSPTTGSTTKNPVAQVTGTTEVGVSVTVNGLQAVVSTAGAFTVAVPLLEGSNTITVTATDPAGNVAVQSITVTYNNPLPAAQASIGSLTTTVYALIAVAAVALVLSLVQMFRGRAPPGRTREPSGAPDPSSSVEPASGAKP